MCSRYYVCEFQQKPYADKGRPRDECQHRRDCRGRMQCYAGSNRTRDGRRNGRCLRDRCRSVMMAIMIS